jgi:hypothetical protein
MAHLERRSLRTLFGRDMSMMTMYAHRNPAIVTRRQ